MAMPAIGQPFSQQPTLVPKRELPYKASPVAKARVNPVKDLRTDVYHTSYAHSRPDRVGVHTQGVAVA
eukprot:7537742-Heterocapsa_arctica.AAC.1